MTSLLRLGAAMCALALPGVALAEPIRHPTAVFAGLDKTTGRIINFEVAIDETVLFGTLNVTPRVCNTRPQTEAPQTTSFVEVDEVVAKQDRQPRAEQAKADAGKQETKRIFSGWMFAASPGLHGVEHPVYDVWLVDCKGGATQPAAGAAPTAEAPPSTAEAAAPAPDAGKKRRSRKVEPKAPAPVENQPIGPADQALPEPTLDTPSPEQPVGEEPAQPAPRKKKRKPRPEASPEPGQDPFLPF
jgi:hypothetical protein